MQQATVTPFQAGVSLYNSPKPPGDIDLVEACKDLLVRSGLGSHIEIYESDRRVQDARGKISHVQRHLLNIYWTQQLMYGKTPSIEERYCLVPNGEISDWLNLFESKVLPYLLHNNLPVKV